MHNITKLSNLSVSLIFVHGPLNDCLDSVLVNVDRLETFSVLVPSPNGVHPSLLTNFYH